MKYRYCTFFYSLIVFSLLQSCVNLKVINTFTSSSQKSLENNSSISYGYYDYCYDYCYLRNSKAEYLEDVNCDCTSYRNYDTVIKNEFTIMASYYAGLTKLTGSKSTINFSPIGKAVKDGKYGDITVSKDEAQAVNTLSTVASDLLTIHYKSRKFKEILEKYDDTVQGYLSLLLFHIDNLKSKIDNMRSEYHTICDSLLKHATSQSEKWTIIKIYKEKEKIFSKVLENYNNLYRSLDKLKTADKLMRDNINSLKSKGFKKAILNLTSDILYLSINSKN